MKSDYWQQSLIAKLGHFYAVGWAPYTKSKKAIRNEPNVNDHLCSLFDNSLASRTDIADANRVTRYLAR